MPLARTRIDRQAKMDEILASAQKRLVSGGYHNMSVAGIARELGLAQNSIYWYFPSKDDLFVAVLRQMLAELATKKPSPGRGLVSQVLWTTDQMYELASLRAELRERAKHTAAAADFDRELDRLLRHLVIHAIEGNVPSDQLDLSATAFLATVEGTIRMGLPRNQRHRTIQFALEKLLSREREPVAADSSTETARRKSQSGR
ncbi:MAG TPA: helix-turn-helix domain-containing protein [Acidimicrobiales bacterium]